MLEFKNHKKAKENLPVCTVYGYVCKLKFAMKFKIFERYADAGSDGVLQVGAGSACASARRSDFIRPRSKNRVPYAVGTSGGCREYLYSRSEVGLCSTEK